MTEKALTEIAGREFAGDESFLAGPEPERLLIILLGGIEGTNAVPRQVDLARAALAGAGPPSAAPSVDEALAARHEFATEQR